MRDDSQKPLKPSQNQQAPQSPVGSLHKEGLVGPVDYVKPSEAEPVLTEEQIEAGVRTHPNNVDLTDEHKEIGLRHEGQSVPAPTLTSSSAQLPREEKVKEGIKGTKPTDSRRGLWLLVLKAIRRGVGANA